MFFSCSRTSHLKKHCFYGLLSVTVVSIIFLQREGNLSSELKFSNESRAIFFFLIRFERILVSMPLVGEIKKGNKRY